MSRADWLMVTHPIRAVMFDVGGTLEEPYYDDTIRQEATCGLQDLLRRSGLDSKLGLPGLREAVLSGMAVYQE